MNVPGGDTVLKQKVFEIGAARKPLSARRCTQPAFICNFPDVPVLSETLLQMELAVGERPVELPRVAQVILSDPGATIQVMRLAGREFAGSGPADRIEDCISGLDLQACLGAMSKRTIARSNRHSEIVDTWDHARVIAHTSALLVDQMELIVTPEDATLVGLCHEVGRLPELLGWGCPDQLSSDIDLVGLSIGEALSLPRCVREYFADRRNGKTNSVWTAIVDRAHEIEENGAAA